MLPGPAVRGPAIRTALIVGRLALEAGMTLDVALVYPRHAADGGVERNLDQLAGHLCRRGHAVRILCRRHGEPPHPALRFARIRTRGLNPAARRRSFAAGVAARLAREPADVVYDFGRSWSGDAIRMGSGCHATYLERMGHAPSRKDRIELELERRALDPARVRAVVTNSAMVRRDVIDRYGLAPHLVRVIANGVDLQRFDRERHAEPARALRTGLGWSREARVALFLGTGFARKGLPTALRALAGADDTRLHLLVVGGDRHLADYRALADELGVGTRCAFLGLRRDVETCYAASDCFILPTRYDPFANSTLEALAMQLPVITSTDNGGSEVLDPACGSVIADPDDIPAWSTALARWLSDSTRVDARPTCRAVAEANRAELALVRHEHMLLEVAQTRS